MHAQPPLRKPGSSWHSPIGGHRIFGGHASSWRRFPARFFPFAWNGVDRRAHLDGCVSRRGHRADSWQSFEPRPRSCRIRSTAAHVETPASRRIPLRFRRCSGPYLALVRGGHRGRGHDGTDARSSGVGKASFRPGYPAACPIRNTFFLFRPGSHARGCRAPSQGCIARGRDRSFLDGPRGQYLHVCLVARPARTKGSDCLFFHLGFCGDGYWLRRTYRVSRKNRFTSRADAKPRA